MGNIPTFRDRQRMKEHAVQREEEHDAEKAFKDGVEESSDVPKVFIDPDEIQHQRHIHKRPGVSNNPEKSFKKQMEGQIEGSSDKLLEKFNGNEEDDGDKLSFRQLARIFKNHSPAAAANIGDNENQFGVIITPKHDWDTKEEILTQFTSYLDKDTQKQIIANTPGTDKEWLRLIGNHEGEHLNRHDKVLSPGLEKLQEEARADRSAISRAESRGEHELILAYKDLRHLNAHVDKEHATGPLLNSKDPVNFRHVNGAIDHRPDMNGAVKDHFEWENYKGKATTPKELLRENPEEYFKASNKGIEELKAEVMEAYNKNPSLLTTQSDIISAQINIDYQNNFEDAYRRRVLGQDIPERAPTQLIGQEQENKLYLAEKIDEQINDTRRFHGLNARNDYSNTNIFENFDWESYDGVATNAADLFDENPEAYFDYEIQSLEQLKHDAIAAYETDPSYENTGKLLEVQHIIKHNYNFINEWREDNPIDQPQEELDTTPFVPMDVEHEYYIKLQGIIYSNDIIDTAIYPEVSKHWQEMNDAYSLDNTFKDFDWKSYDGDATNAAELFDENPELHHETEVQYFKQLKQEAMTAYEANPSYENTEKLIELQMVMNNRFDIINMERLDALDDDSGEIAKQLDLPDFVPKDVERAYYQERIKRNSQPENKQETSSEIDKGYTKGVDGTAFTTTVKPTGGDLKVDLEKGITVGNQPINDAFAKTANPEPETVSLINAKINIVPPIAQTNASNDINYSVQNLG